MNEFDDIHLPADFDDLSEHAPLLEKLRVKGDGFVVPEQYFEKLEEKLVDLIQLLLVIQNWNDNSTDKQQQTNNNQETNIPFIVPKDYFENLADEVIALANLSSIKSKEPFEVPDSYFAELDESLNTKIALDNLKQDEGFVVPENYFEKFSEKVLSRVAVDESNTGSAEEIPEGYFDTLADRIAARIAEEEGTNQTLAEERGRMIVFSEVLKRYARPLSLAASVALLMGVSVWFFNRAPLKNEMAYQPKKYFAPVAPGQDSSFSFPVKAKEEVAAVKKQKVQPAVNHVEERLVQQINRKDVLEHLDLLDEGTVVDFVNSSDTDLSNSTDNSSLNQSMIDYINSDSDELPTRDINKK